MLKLNSIVAALRFFFTHTLDRPDLARKLIRTSQTTDIGSDSDIDLQPGMSSRGIVRGMWHAGQGAGNGRVTEFSSHSGPLGSDFTLGGCFALPALPTDGSGSFNDPFGGDDFNGTLSVPQEFVDGSGDSAWSGNFSDPGTEDPGLGGGDVMGVDLGIRRCNE